MDSTVMTVICVLLCTWIAYKSRDNMRKGTIDSGAQTVVTIGVLFTFVGIAWSLLHFDTNVTNMINSINDFISGMKTAFWTSIVGMIFGIIIKLMQSGAEQKEDEFIRKNLSAIDLTNNAVRNNTTTLLSALNEIKASLDANSTVQLQRELNRLITTMETFINSSAESRSDMRNLSERMSDQSKMLERLGSTLTQNIENFGKIQSKSLETLSKKIVESGNNQSKRLDVMSQTIDKMRLAIEMTQENSRELLTKSEEYQRESLANDKNQAKILTDNTAQIVAMKKSFDGFLNDMATNFSQEFIAALTVSIEKLNTQLQTQFGENFKELNSAVREVVAWQREYKEIVELTTSELKHINKVFTDFTQTISVAVEKQIATLTKNLKSFGDSTNKNVAVQKELCDAVIQLGEVVKQSKAAIEQMQTMTNNFEQFSDKILKSNQSVLEKHLVIVDKTVEDFGKDVKKLQDKALTFTTDTSDYLRNFNTVSKDVMKGIREALEAFKNDFSSETKKSVDNLSKLLAVTAKNTDVQSQKAVQNLAGALGAINNQMIDNYRALIQRIAELDRIINESGHKP